MAYYHQPRQQSRPYRYDDDFVTPDLERSYNPYDEAPPRRVRREPATDGSSGPPPRRYKSERGRRPRSPGRPVHRDESMVHGRGPGYRNHSNRHESERRGHSVGPDRRSRKLSPPPFGPPPDSPRRKARSARPERESYRPEREHRQPPREPRPGRERDVHIRDERGRRLGRDQRYKNDSPSSSYPYDRDPYIQGPPQRGYPDEARETHRAQNRDPNADYPPRRHGRSLPPADRSRSRGRTGRSRYSDSGSDTEDDHYVAGAAAAGAGAAAAGRRRPRSQGRDRRGRNHEQSPTRGRPPITQKSRGAPSGRRSSMPASTKNKAAAWWQNPMVQAGARTAFTAGAQAAMKSGKESGPWLGPKGAKVATAALGAALVDGFMGQKHPDSTRQKLMREGLNLASAQTGKVPERRGSSHYK
ncbi:hypothetical protein FPOAC2_05226 [Fusarium poae]|jgi:hypothetical protein|uniref:Uncharacterized protein n=1 Tax=Fusarium poae TaxID=36050 RepID=A0A1B8AUB5_FUSPO|nr:hypothetical protein FPOAC1_005123 [Fusarium poae]KAG8671865.1 hypothetical protein FPOAC1_005123 [Fusarium poae]OBS24087.1 hypothetical protein FPOA_04635 [Fusarium poae]